MSDVKYSSLEVDGVELLVPTERLLTADDLKLTTAGTTLADTYWQEIIDRYCGASQSQVPSFLANGELDTVVFYSSATQTTANRIIGVQVNYDGSLNPTSEVWTIYDTADGTTVLKTVTLTHTWVSSEITNTQVSVA